MVLEAEEERLEGCWIGMNRMARPRTEMCLGWHAVV